MHPDETDIIFVAAGVGITPNLSMLRHMRNLEEDRSVLLLDGNRREQVSREELEGVAAGDHPRLEIVHVLSAADEGWAGAAGHIDEALLRRVVGRVERKAFYVCGPSAMAADVGASLRRLGVSERAIHLESFSL